MSKEIPLHVVFVEAWITNENGQFLLAKRSAKDDQNAGAWSIPGGKVEKDLCNNIIEQTLEKEVLEEVGIKITNITYLASRSFIRSSGDTVVALSFAAELASGTAEPLDEQDEIAWVTKDELPIYLHEKHWENALEKLLEK